MKLSVGSVIELKEAENRRFLITKIVKGGFGIVYFLKSLSNFCDCVMKTFKEGVSLEDIEKEAFAWAQLGENQNIATFITYGIFNEKPYVLSPRFSSSLDSLIGSKGLSCKELKEIFIGVVNGLKYAYEKMNLIHRDIKPANIFLDELIPKIGDFGLSVYERFDYKKELDNNSLQKYTKYTEGSWGGTLPYMAPELFIKPIYDISTDIYALGVSFFEIFSGGLFPYYVHSTCKDEQAFILFERNCVDKEFREIILKCIALDKMKRFKSYNEFEKYFNLKNNSKESIAEIVNTIQLLKRSNKIDQALEYAKEEFKKNDQHPLILNQIALIYQMKKDMKMFEFTLSDYLLSHEIGDNVNYYFEPLFNLLNYYFDEEDREKFLFTLERFEQYFDHNKNILLLYPEYGVYLGLKGKFNECLEVFSVCSTQIKLLPKYWLFYCCICEKTNNLPLIRKAISLREGDFENIMKNNIRSDDEIQLLVKECCKKYKEFMGVLF